MILVYVLWFLEAFTAVVIHLNLTLSIQPLNAQEQTAADTCYMLKVYLSDWIDEQRLRRLH